MQSQTTLFRPRDLRLQPRFVRLLLGSHPLPAFPYSNREFKQIATATSTTAAGS